jgi:hypothetical protein
VVGRQELDPGVRRRPDFLCYFLAVYQEYYGVLNADV